MNYCFKMEPRTCFYRVLKSWDWLFTSLIPEDLERKVSCVWATEGEELSGWRHSEGYSIQQLSQEMEGKSGKSDLWAPSMTDLHGLEVDSKAPIK